ncbi:MAG: FkbM family methyltransferase [Paracoccaceae bacterium]
MTDLPPISAGAVVRCTLWNEPVFFTITDARDAIQAEHRAGRFYETEELDIIRKWLRPDSTFCDIGANIGNHTLFVLKLLRAARAILFEPNPAAIAVLRSNLVLNGVEDRCDLSHLGCGLSDSAQEGLSVHAPRRNLGGGRMVAVEGGTLAVIRGDSVLADQPVDFIKIDVEGMEMRFLAGLDQTLARWRPRLFVEVDRKNFGDFRLWLRGTGYAVQDRFRRYRANENFLLVHPQEPPPPGFLPSR